MNPKFVNKLFEALGPKWFKPSFSKEQAEFDRVAGDSGHKTRKLRKAFHKGKMSDLSDEEWSKLHNTDSYETDTQEKADKQAKLYDRNIDSIHSAIRKSGKLPAPIVYKNHKGEHHLLGGNTRLMASRINKIRPKVWKFDLPK
jgi:inorganic triphosphatase YgiF